MSNNGERDSQKEIPNSLGDPKDQVGNGLLPQVVIPFEIVVKWGCLEENHRGKANAKSEQNPCVDVRHEEEAKTRFPFITKRI